MNTIPDKNKDALSQLFHKDQLEKPNPQFTDNVMKELGITPVVQPVQAKPIIPLLGWIIIAVTSITIMMIAVFGNNSGAFSNSELISSSIVNNAVSYMDSLLHSKILLYAAMLSVIIFLLFCFDSWYRVRQFNQINVRA